MISEFQGNHQFNKMNIYTEKVIFSRCSHFDNLTTVSIKADYINDIVHFLNSSHNLQKIKIKMCDSIDPWDMDVIDLSRLPKSLEYCKIYGNFIFINPNKLTQFFTIDGNNFSKKENVKFKIKNGIIIINNENMSVPINYFQYMISYTFTKFFKKIQKKNGEESANNLYNIIHPLIQIEECNNKKRKICYEK